MSHKSKADILIAEIRKHDKGILSTELAKATRIERNSITALLATALDRGDVTSCKVTVPGRQETNLYRIGCGVAPRPVPAPLNLGKQVHFSRGAVGNGTPPAPLPVPKTIVHPFDDEIQPTRRAGKRQAQREVAQNTRSAVLTPSLASPKVKGRAVAEKPAPTDVSPLAGCDDSVIELVQAMDAEQFGEYVGHLSRAWSWAHRVDTHHHSQG